MSEDADGDPLAITAASSDTAQATVSVAADSSKVTLTGVPTITITARDDRGSTASVTFAAAVVAAPTQPESKTPTPAEKQDVVARYDTDGDGESSLAENNAAIQDLGATLTMAALIMLRAA